MKPSRIQQVLTAGLSKGLQFLVYGEPGGSKTAIITAAAKEAGVELVLEHPAVADPTDAKGLPGLGKDGAHFYPIGFVKKLIAATKPTLCLLDDFGQAPHAVQAAYMQLIHGKRLNGHTLPAHVSFCIATNSTGDRAGVNAILEPVKSRFHAILKLDVDQPEWCLWAYNAGIADEVIAFIKFRPELLMKPSPSRELVNSPSPRTWHHASDLFKAGITDAEALGGAVGEGAAAEFLGFLRVYQSLPNIDEILTNPLTAKVPKDPTGHYAVAVALVRRAKKDNLGRIISYLARIGKEFEVLALRDILRVNPGATECAAFNEWAAKNEDVMG